MRINWPKNLSEKTFLEQYWQKKPLLIKQGFPHLPEIITPDELAGLSCEDGIESRILIQDSKKQKWFIEHGPFRPKRFKKLPETHWTLLVQDTDKYISEAQSLLQSFHFVPSWRLDDLMISYATDQGSVGPHTDHYDVFLIQLSGKRLWKISSKVYTKQDLEPNCDTQILKDFDCSEEWIVESGDILYLPPNVAHWGIAHSECLTGSVGFVSPRQDMLFNSWADEISGSLHTDHYYQDTNIMDDYADRHHAEISATTIKNLTSMLRATINTEPNWLSSVFGKMLSEPKANLMIEPLPHDEQLSKEAFLNLFMNNILVKHTYLRLFFIQSTEHHYQLFANGDEFRLPQEANHFIQLLCDFQEYRLNQFAPWFDNHDIMNCLATFYNKGYLFFEDE